MNTRYVWGWKHWNKAVIKGTIKVRNVQRNDKKAKCREYWYFPSIPLAHKCLASCLSFSQIFLLFFRQRRAVCCKMYPFKKKKRHQRNCPFYYNKPCDLIIHHILGRDFFGSRAGKCDVVFRFIITRIKESPCVLQSLLQDFQDTTTKRWERYWGNTLSTFHTGIIFYVYCGVSCHLPEKKEREKFFVFFFLHQFERQTVFVPFSTCFQFAKKMKYHIFFHPFFRKWK